MKQPMWRLLKKCYQIPDMVLKIIVSRRWAYLFQAPFVSILIKRNPNLVVTSAFYTDWNNHKDAQKGIAVAHYAEHWLIDERKLANGDNFNDVSMIRDAGLVLRDGEMLQTSWGWFCDRHPMLMVVWQKRFMTSNKKIASLSSLSLGEGSFYNCETMLENVTWDETRILHLRKIFL